MILDYSLHLRMLHSIADDVQLRYCADVIVSQSSTQYLKILTASNVTLDLDECRRIFAQHQR